MIIRNLLRHPVTLLPLDGEPITIEPDPEGPARVVETSRRSMPGYGLPVPVVESTWGHIRGLPDAAPETVYLVSGMVRVGLDVAGRDRPDVLVPDDVERVNGRIVGYHLLSL